MTDRTIVSQIIQALADYLKQDAARITEEHHLRDDLGLDSMAVIELLYKIEETFNIQIPDQDLAAMSTVGSVATYVEGRLTPVKSATSRSTPSAPKSKGKKKERVTVVVAPPSHAAVRLSAIHELVGGELYGSGDTAISALAGLHEAHAQALSFIANDKAAKSSGPLRAGALLVHRHFPDVASPQIVVAHPLLSFAEVAQKFFVHPPAPTGIAEQITRGADVHIGPDASIWPFVTLGDRVILGARVTLYPGVYVGADSRIGDDAVLYPNVVVREGCSLGARVVVHSGTVIGADGFGYVQHQGRHHKIPQLGGVIIEDDVELGANVTVDRATLGQTTIKRGTKVDNLVQIAHNVSVGEHTIVVAQVGIAGSSSIGHHVMIGGQAGIGDHIQVGDQVMIAARAGVNRNLEPNQIVSGAPVMPHETWMKAQAVIPRLPELRQLVRSLEQRVAMLETQLKQASSARPAKRRSPQR